MATSTVTGTVTNPAGTALQYVVVKAVLKPRPAFTTATGAELSVTYETITDSSGQYVFTLTETASITPADSYYEITEYISARYGGPVKHTIQVGASNTTVLASLVSTPPTPDTDVFLTQAAGDARYVQSPGSFGAAGDLSTIDPDDSASAGALNTYARSDHQHAIVAAVAGSITPGDTAAEGVATSFSRSDHKHGVVRTSGTAAQRGAWATAAEPGQLYYETDTDILYLALESDGTMYLGLAGGVTPYLVAPVISQGVTTNIAKTINSQDVYRTGTFINASVYLALTAAGTAGSDVTVTLPIQSARSDGTLIGSALILDASTGLYYHCAARQASSTTVAFTTPAAGTWGTNPNLALASGDLVWMNISYRCIV